MAKRGRPSSGREPLKLRLDPADVRLLEALAGKDGIDRTVKGRVLLSRAIRREASRRGLTPPAPEAV